LVVWVWVVDVSVCGLADAALGWYGGGMVRDRVIHERDDSLKTLSDRFSEQSI